MADSLSEEHPAKRVKLSSHHLSRPHFNNYNNSGHGASSLHASLNMMATAGHAPPPPRTQMQSPMLSHSTPQTRAHQLAPEFPLPSQPLHSGANPLFDDGWTWPPSLDASVVPQMPSVLMMSPVDQHQASSSAWVAGTDITTTTFIAPAAPPEFDVSPTTAVHPVSAPLPAAQQTRYARLLPAVPGEQSPDPPPPRHEQRRRKTRAKPALLSPFKDCVNTFGLSSGPLAYSPRYPRPSDGKVNGYIKFHWPKNSEPKHRSVSFSAVTEITEVDEDSPDSQGSEVSGMGPPGSAVIASSSMLQANASEGFSSNEMTTLIASITPSATQSPYATMPLTEEDTSAELVPVNAPRVLPQQFGLDAKMDLTDRRFWTFYIRNWCPGRSVLKETNLWLKDFGSMQQSDGVRAAIQCLAGTYIYDYQPLEAIRRRVNERFHDAESRLSYLLTDPASLDKTQSSELVTIASILSMQDIVLTERRLQKPFNPRWLQGFRQAEHILQMFDQGTRFWNPKNVQRDSLQISQSVIVGRAIILSQPMMPLTTPNSFDPEQEASRFGWLLYGSIEDMYLIHGGCGFSKKLLHSMSQISYCAARLVQERDSPLVPVTAKYLLEDLSTMRQWDLESTTWEESQSGPQVIEWARTLPSGYIIDSPGEMTLATAEAWRFAAIVYAQCRVLRLPRHDPEVTVNLGKLAACIEIMPTSGEHFTAQAPLFPVFLLGLLATDAEHNAIARKWFDQVVQTPVRSSVPPLYKALKRIRTWLDTEMEIPATGHTDLPEAIGMRKPWWERMVARVQEKEQETLCLT